MKQKIKSHFILIPLLIVLNVILVYNNILKQNKINTLASTISIYEDKERNEEYDKNIFKNIKYNNFTNELKIISIISQNGCIACIKSEINHLNDLVLKYPQQVDVYFIGRNKNFLKAFDANFIYKTIADVKDIVETDVTITQPIALLIDSDKNIQKFNIASATAPEKTKQFYMEVLSLFKIIDED